MRRTPLGLVLVLLGCGKDASPLELTFPDGFKWGVATASHQIEGGITTNNWYQFETLDAFAGKVIEPAGEGVRGWELFETDASLAQDLGVGVYRMSVEWSRLEPTRDQWDEAAFDHYREVFEDLRSKGLEPMVTFEHYTEPIWVQDLEHLDCPGGPSDSNLCGWTNPAVAAEFGEFAGEVASRFGDLVDEWSTYNEPLVYLLSGYIIGVFPPGYQELSVEGIQANAIPVLSGMLDGHAAAYAAVHAADTDDADGDGTSARVGFTSAVVYFEPADPTDPEDVAAAAVATSLVNYLFSDAVINGLLDEDVDGDPTEEHPEWAGTCDLLGIQYYNRMRVVGTPGLLLGFFPCDPRLTETVGITPSSLGCPEIPADDQMNDGTEHFPEGLRRVLEAAAERYPGQALRVTENGITTANGTRRAQSIVKHMQELTLALEGGAPVDGYIHWTLMDNYGWAYGYTLPFGLYTVDRSTFARSPTLGSNVFGDIVRDNGARASLIDAYGGPMVSEVPTRSPPN